MNSEERGKLDGALVFVRPGEKSGENPEVGLRGTVHVSDTGDVSIQLDYAAMFYGGVRQQNLKLNERDIEQLLRSEYEGNFFFRVDGPLEGPPTDR